jgi:serine/threonine protein kinase
VDSLIKVNNLGICHRDIKPSNILYDHQKGYYVFSDWGEAKKYSTEEDGIGE